MSCSRNTKPIGKTVYGNTKCIKGQWKRSNWLCEFCFKNCAQRFDKNDLKPFVCTLEIPPTPAFFYYDDNCVNIPIYPLAHFMCDCLCNW